MPVSKPFFSAFSMRLQRSAGALALLDERRERRIVLRGRASQRMVGRDRHELGAEQRVGPRRVDLEFASRRRAAVAGSSGEAEGRPSERPIQLRCISRTFSGQRSRVSSAS